jgi:signal transduction histidine kinase
MGGTITAEPAREGGACFTVALPTAAPSPTAPIAHETVGPSN